LTHTTHPSHLPALAGIGIREKNHIVEKMHDFNYCKWSQTDQRGESAIWIANSMRKVSWYSVTGKYPYLSAGQA
jgi:hypothetical protein